MTNLEILNLALIGVCVKLQREEEINRSTIKEYGRENNIALNHIQKLNKQYDEIRNLILIEERKQAS